MKAIRGTIYITILTVAFLFIACSGEQAPQSSVEGVQPENKWQKVDKPEYPAQPLWEETASAVQHKQSEKHHLTIGFNIGYLNYLKDENFFKPILAKIHEDGFKDLRIYEPFTKDVVSNRDKAFQTFKELAKADFQILLSLSNYPYKIDQNRVDKHPDYEKIKNAAKFTNRFGPDDLTEYATDLTWFMDRLKSDGALDNFDFEIGNEVDAPKYFWGSYEEMLKIINVTLEVMNKYDEEVMCCGFSTSLSTKAKIHHPTYREFIESNDLFDQMNLSYHYYLNSKDTWNNIHNINYPHLEGSSITEINVFSHQRIYHEDKMAYTNSPGFITEMVPVIQFCYENRVASLYMFKLADIAEKKERLGFFDVNGEEKGSYFYLKHLNDVIKGGFTVIENDDFIEVISSERRLLLAQRNQEFSVESGQIILSSQISYSGAMETGDWIIINE